MFRNFHNIIPNEVRCTILFEVVDDKIVEANTHQILPSSNDYSLKDLLAAGVKVAQVDPTIVHDSITTNAVARDFVDNYVEPSNNVDNESKI